LDLHIHTTYSGDSIVTPELALKIAKIKKLDGFAITDHNTLKAYDLIKKKNRNDDLIIIPGMEIKTNIGEIIGLFISEEINTQVNDFFLIVEEIKDNNGLVIIPHPFDFLRDNRLKINLLSDNTIKKYIDGIEIINSRIIFKRCINKARKFNLKYQLFETGGSDAHSNEEIGNAYTLISDIDYTFESIRKSLLANKSKSMGVLSSPFVHAKTVFNKLKKGLYF
jgi:predicted metal-dependent phosphoesterase TrpH